MSLTWLLTNYYWILLQTINHWNFSPTSEHSFYSSSAFLNSHNLSENYINWVLDFRKEFFNISNSILNMIPCKFSWWLSRIKYLIYFLVYKFKLPIEQRAFCKYQLSLNRIVFTNDIIQWVFNFSERISLVIYLNSIKRYFISIITVRLHSLCWIRFQSS